MTNRRILRRAARAVAVVAALLAVGLGVVYFRFPGAIFAARTTLERLSLGVEHRTVPVGDHTWPYLEGGAGEPVLVLHGFGLHKDRVLPLAEAFGDGHRLIVPDLPAFGENRALPGADYGIEAQAERLHDFVEALGLEAFHLVGHSYGGGIAAWYAGEHTEDVLSLTLVAAFGVDPGPGSVLLEQWKEDPDKTLCVDSREDLERVFELAYEHPPAMPDHFKDHVVELASPHHDTHTRIFQELASQLGILEPRLHLVAAPTLIVWGREDRILPVSSAATFDRGIERSRVEVVPDAGHAAFLDQHERVLAAVQEFQASLDD